MIEEILDFHIFYKIWLQALKCNPHLSLEVDFFCFIGLENVLISPLSLDLVENVPLNVQWVEI